MTTRPNSSALCTLNRIIQRLNADSSSINVSTTAGQTTQINTESANFKAEMTDCIYKASDLIQRAMNNTFVPYVDTHTWRGREYRRNWCYDRELAAYTLTMPESLLSVTTFTWDGTALTTSQYYTRFEGKYPAHEIAIDPDAIATYPDDFTDTVSLVAVWGYHNDPDNMWQDSGDTGLTAGVNASVATIPVASGNNFEILQYIRIDSEYMLITGISSNNLTVERGVRGTTAASHLISTVPDVFVPIEDVADECARLAIRRYQLRSGNEFIPTGDGGVVEVGLRDVQLSNSYKRYYIGSA